MRRETLIRQFGHEQPFGPVAGFPIEQSSRVRRRTPSREINMLETPFLNAGRRATVGG